MPQRKEIPENLCNKLLKSISVKTFTKQFLRLWGSIKLQSVPYCPNGESLEDLPKSGQPAKFFHRASHKSIQEVTKNPRATSRGFGPLLLGLRSMFLTLLSERNWAKMGYMAEYHSIKLGVSRQKSLHTKNNMNARFKFANKQT